MPPKKRVTKQEDQPLAETSSKPTQKIPTTTESKKQQQQSQPHSEPQQVPAKVPPTQNLTAPTVSAATSKPVETATSQPLPQLTAPTLVSQKSQKIAIDDAAKLSEQQKIRLRKLRFGSIGTEATGQEAEKIKQERQKKFGASNQQIEKQLIEKRKQKFATSSASLAGQNLQVLKKRLEKFGNTSAAIVPEDKDLIEQRKKKFGNPELEVNLDEEIKKTKQIHKFYPNKNHFHHNRGYQRR